MSFFRASALFFCFQCSCFNDHAPIAGKAPSLADGARMDGKDRKGKKGRTKNGSSKPLGAPWSEMGLPTDKAHVMEATEKHLMLGFTVDAPTADQWTAALQATGWTEENRALQESGGEAFVFSKEDKSLGLAIGVDDGGTVVYLENVHATGADQGEPGEKEPKPHPQGDEKSDPKVP